MLAVDKDETTQGNISKEEISEAPAESLEQDGAGQAEVTSYSAAAAVVLDDSAGKEDKESESQKPTVLEAMEKEDPQVEEKEQREGDNRGSIEEPDESSAGQGLKLSELVEAAAPDPPQVKHLRNIPCAAPPLGHLTCVSSDSAAKRGGG